MSTVSLSTDERVSVRLMGLSYCPRCDKVVELLSFDEAARAYNTDLQDITWLAEKGSLHRLHNRRAYLMICGPSLFNVFENRRTRLLTSSFGTSAAAWREGIDK